MSEKDENLHAGEAVPKKSAKIKRPYKKPAFQHEKPFETMALACGKVSATQAICRFNRKRS